MRILFLIGLFFGLLFGQEIGKPFVQAGHSADIDLLQFSPDKKILVSTSLDVIKFWSVKTGKNIYTIRDYSGRSAFFKFISGGKAFLYIDNKDNIKMIETKNFQQMEILENKVETHRISTSVNGRYLIFDKGKKTQVWDLKTKKLIKKIKFNESIFWSKVVNNTGEYIALYRDSLKMFDIFLFNVESGKLVKRLKGHNAGIQSVVFSPDGKTMVSGDRGGKVRLWSVKDINSIGVFDNFASNKIDLDYDILDRVMSLTFSPNGKVLAISGEDKIKLWDISEEKMIGTLKSLGGYHPIIFTKDSQFLITSNHLEIWNINTQKLVNKFKGGDNAILSNSNDLLAYSINNIIYLWDMKNQKHIRKITGNNLQINDIDIFPKGKDIVLGIGNKIGVWDNNFGKLSIIIKDKQKAIKSVAFCKKGNLLASISDWASDIKLWDVKTGDLRNIFKGHKHRINSILFINDDSVLISASHDETVKFWDVKTGKLLRTLKGFDDQVQSLFINNDESVLVILTSYGKIKGWNLKENKWISLLDLEANNFGMFDEIITNGKQLLSVAKAGYGINAILKFWDFDTGKLLSTRRLLSKNHSFSGSILSLDAKQIYSPDQDGNILIWDINSGKLNKVLTGYSGRMISSLKLSHDGKILVSVSHGVITYWDIVRMKELFRINIFDDGEWVAITPEGYFNASKNGAKHLNVLTGPLSVTSVDAYYETFYRPDIVRAAMKGKTVDTGLSMSDIKPAPQVEIVNTPSKINKDEVEVTLSIKDIGGGVGDIRLYVNGVAVKTDSRDIVRQQSKDTIIKHYVLKLPKGKNTIKALVFNEANTMQSNDALHTITANYKTIHKPQLHALIIGIDTFKNPKLRLRYAVSDAQLFADTIESQSKGIFSKVVMHKLDTNETTSKEAITQKLKELQNLNPDDLFVFYVASHGTVDDGEYYLITSNVGSTSTRKLKSDAITQKDLKRLIANVPTTKKLIVLDTCNAGAMGNALLTRGMSEDTAMKILSRAVGSTVLSAATSQQQALEGYKGHGLFTYVLTEGLKGKADSNHDGYIKTLELANYIDDEVPPLAEKLFNRAQYPVVSPSGQAFPVGKVK